MTTTLLAYFPSPSRGVWYLGPVPIRAYAMFIIIGIVVALVLGDRRWTVRGGERGVIYDIALWAVPFGLVGGRLYHLITDWRTYFGQNGAGPAAALRIWDGGLGIWGAVALGGVGAWIACRRRGIPLPAFGDAVAPGIILAQAIGRLGNYFNQELYGRETTVRWGLVIFKRVNASGIVDPHLLDGVSTGQVYKVVHPTFLYELLWNILVFAILIYVDRKYRIGHGRLFALYVAGYCVGRFWVELLRDDRVYMHPIGDLRVNSFTATFVFLGAVVYMMVAPKGREDPATLGGRQPETEVVEAGTPEPEQAVMEAPEPDEAVVGEGESEPQAAQEPEPDVSEPEQAAVEAAEPAADEVVGEEESDPQAAEETVVDEPADQSDATQETAESSVSDNADESADASVAPAEAPAQQRSRWWRRNKANRA